MMVRVYANGLPFAHLIKQYSDEKALCGRTPFPSNWSGLNLTSERDKARTMPLCSSCRTVLLHHSGGR